MAPAEVLDAPTSPHRPSSAIGKRKRSDGGQHSQPNGITLEKTPDADGSLYLFRLGTLMKDLLYILKRSVCLSVNCF